MPYFMVFDKSIRAHVPVQVIENFPLNFIDKEFILSKFFFSDLYQGVFHVKSVLLGNIHGVQRLPPPDCHGENAGHAVHDDPSRVRFVVNAKNCF